MEEIYTVKPNLSKMGGMCELECTSFQSPKFPGSFPGGGGFLEFFNNLQVQGI
jgi:hypothetical protein